MVFTTLGPEEEDFSGHLLEVFLCHLAAQCGAEVRGTVP